MGKRRPEKGARYGGYLEPKWLRWIQHSSLCGHEPNTHTHAAVGEILRQKIPSPMGSSDVGPIGMQEVRVSWDTGFLNSMCLVGDLCSGQTRSRFFEKKVAKTNAGRQEEPQWIATQGLLSHLQYLGPTKSSAWHPPPAIVTKRSSTEPRFAEAKCAHRRMYSSIPLDGRGRREAPPA